MSYPARALSGLGVERAPAETPPVSAYYPTHPLSGVRDHNTQGTLHALGAVTNNVRLASNLDRYINPSILPAPVIVSTNPPAVTPVAVSAPSPSTQPTTQPTPWTQPNGGGPGSWQRNRASGGWGTSAVPATQPAAASPPDAGTAAQAGTPVPFNWPVGSPYTDTNGNIWTYQNGTWAITSSVPSTAQQGTATPTTWQVRSYPTGVALQPNGPAAATAQAGSPVPVGWPTSQAYTDSNGNIWTYTATAGWQVTGTSASQSALLAAEESSLAAAAPTGTSAASGGTTVTLSTGSDTWDTITTWLQESTVIPNVPNFFLVAGAGVVGLLIYSRGGHR